MAMSKKDETKLQSLLVEYQTLSKSTMDLVKGIFQFVSVNTALWTALFISAYVFQQPVLFLVATAILLLLIWECGPVVSLGYSASVRMGEIEEAVNGMFGEDFFGWQLRGGLYMSVSSDVVARKIFNYTVKFIWGAAFIVFTLGSFSFYNGVLWLYGISQLLTIIVGLAYVGGSAITIYYVQVFLLGRYWEKFDKA